MTSPLQKHIEDSERELNRFDLRCDCPGKAHFTRDTKHYVWCNTEVESFLTTKLREAYLIAAEEVEGMKRIEIYPLEARIVVDEKNINYNNGLYDAASLLRSAGQEPLK